ncbi:MAG TPA: L,D-transpeptidase [Solirubrobacterales bacterium]|nr:L,D-transpeptidase [Solirubrobacterales bacterium]
MTRRLSSLIAAACLLALPATALAAPGKKPAPKPAPVAAEATVKIKVGNLENGRAEIMQTVPVTGTLSPFVAGEQIKVTFYRDGKPLFSRNLPVRKDGGKGSFRTSITVKENGKYAVAAKHVATPALGADSTIRKSWKVSFPALRRGQCGDVVVGFKKGMREMGYIANDGRCFGGKTARGVLAYRKVNDMSRSMRAGAGLVKKVFSGKGGYEVRHPGAGDHLEAPLSKQVLVFAKGDEPYAIYPISSGKSSTPTVTGHYEMIRTEPGLNSHGMYYSWYFYGGYAVHGYNSVPDYPASHGCLRTFMSDQPEIYERIFYGQDIFIW